MTEVLPEAAPVSPAAAPAKPNPFDAKVGYGQMPAGLRLSNGPRKPIYLGEVEWAWSPREGRVDAYYIHRSRRHWILWLHQHDDNWGRWDWVPCGYVPLKKADKRAAAFYLIADLWSGARDSIEALDHFHWVEEDAEFSKSDWLSIGKLVWPGQARATGADEAP